MPDFSGRIILITGASGGLGESVTQSFLAAGATVAGVSRSWRGKAPPGHFLPVEADLTNSAECVTAVEQVLAKAGGLHAVLHLMGGFAGGRPVQETDDATWDRMMAINASAAFYVFRAVLPHLLGQRSGRIIAVGSRAGVEAGPALSAYNASKAALNALVRTTAAEVAESGITVNAVLPSTIDTGANRTAMPAADFSKWVSPGSISSALLWLASDEARDVNGALIPIYGRA